MSGMSSVRFAPVTLICNCTGSPMTVTDRLRLAFTETSAAGAPTLPSSSTSATSQPRQRRSVVVAQPSRLWSAGGHPCPPFRFWRKKIAADILITSPAARAHSPCARLVSVTARASPHPSANRANPSPEPRSSCPPPRPARRRLPAPARWAAGVGRSGA